MSNPHYVTGLRAVEQLLATPNVEIKRLYAEYQSVNPRVMAVIKLAQDKGIDIQAANRARLQQLSGEVRHQGVVAQIRRTTLMDEGALRTMVEERLSATDADPLLLLILDAVQDPHNLGACMRSADAAGVDALVIPRHGAAAPGPTVSKVAAGAGETLPHAVVSNLGKTLAWLADYGIELVGTSGAADSVLYDVSLGGPLALVMGGEHGGLSGRVAKRCTQLVRLPMRGTVESLNVSVATGVCLYEVLRQRRHASA